MSSRSAVGHHRGATLGPQPLKATVPYQLANKPRPNRRDGKSAGKPKPHQLSSGMRRTMSLDAIIGPYLQGHWPKEPESQSSLSRKDKSTQTPDSWSDKSQSRRGSSSSHKRSASWGSAEHQREITKLKQQLQQRSKPAVSGGHDKDCQRGYPQGSSTLGTTRTQPIPIPLTPLSTLVPRLRCSVEGLNQELEGMFICQPSHPQHRLLEVPDGHRAPVPLQSCSSGSQSDPATTPLTSSSSSSPSSSPTNLSTSPPNSKDAPLDLHQGLIDSAEMCLLSPFLPQNEADLSLPLLMSSSPGPNKSCCFQREPPEGCEKIRVWEETSAPRQPKPALISSCPDPNKVNFTPHGGSAFCPVSLLKPLLPSMDLLFRSLAVSPAGSCSSQGTSSCQATSSGNWAAPPDPPPAAAAVRGESSGEGLAF
ncbi:protein FAM117A [Etheostoma spectabile]|uniref:protein FAM117A n=1 Tax=Etheostoma spectabile TaxID=54343 RepID=UPI0013AF2367|nr:protein FAM117A-like [Etheostoma spectabile]XP_032358394.1 protein FAM117A-like [Etheostoma spectabile]XP_032358395.1 protein FAM117A-like [Etheostoma spectabile]